MAYGKIFESMFTGSMVGSGCHVFALWSYVIANAKPPGTVELNPRIIATVFGCPIEDVEKAIEYLCQPDPDSRTKECEGRRLIREGQFLYAVPTWEKYNAIRNEIERRMQNREAQRRWREKRRRTAAVSDDVLTPADGKAPSAESANTVCISSTASASVRKGAVVQKRAVADRPEDVTPETWDEWVAFRKGKRAPVTARVLNDTRTKANAAGMSMEAALVHWMTQGYTGFFPPAKGSKAPPAGEPEHPRNTPLGQPNCNCYDCKRFRARKRPEAEPKAVGDGIASALRHVAGGSP